MSDLQENNSEIDAKVQSVLFKAEDAEYPWRSCAAGRCPIKTRDLFCAECIKWHYTMQRARNRAYGVRKDEEIRKRTWEQVDAAVAKQCEERAKEVMDTQPLEPPPTIEQLLKPELKRSEQAPPPLAPKKQKKNNKEKLLARIAATLADLDSDEDQEPKHFNVEV